MSGRVNGKVALVTGAAQGLGEAMSALFVKEGATVYMSDINAEGVAKTAAKVGGIPVTHDVTSAEDWQRVVAKIEGEQGKLNILVNNAGIGGGSTVEDTDIETFRKVHTVNVESTFFGCKYSIPLMRRSGLGSIVNISSIAGIIAGHNMAAYNSAKAAVRHLSKSVALHCARSANSVRCNSVHPVFTRTPILDRIIANVGDETKALAKLSKQIPIGRIGEPEDVAYAVLYLACDESKMVTGIELPVDGGISAQ